MAPGDDDEPEEGPVLAPEELDIASDEHVTEIADGRYVVSPDIRTGENDPAPGPANAPDPGVTDANADEADHDAADLDDATVHAWLREDLAGTASRYGFDVTAAFDGNVSQQRMASNDIVTVFESLMLWYARQVDADTPVEEVLGILLMESSVPVRYPADSLDALLEATDLSPEDSIADLQDAVADEDGVRF